ncbi:endolytic transglycosylase MltG [Niabella beijingensis]|uniref:endolytic transglycosylase MltG n=1 Tax=Niabella beijingensis TaxID=2872700 RepID=UPI001CBFFEE9|nr:endolytic transglycosylase MltG [Niabella beijingensis]MBZ4191752.1 endolytic transglycosylase MltG [Niabella beijingensis]
MAKKKRNYSYILFMILLLLGFTAFKFLGPATGKTDSGFLYVKTGTTMEQLKKQLVSENVLPGTTWFNMTANMMQYRQVKPGKYKLGRGTSILTLVRMLKNGNQTPVDLVITKIRTREALAGRIGKLFECDSSQTIGFLNSSDSLGEYGLDSNTVMAAVQPLTYEIRWNTTPRTIFDKFFEAYKKFWTDERKQKASAQGLTPLQAITLASIIDEETNKAADKPRIASTYMNRIAKGMPLQADPTVKFALKDFGIKRILFGHLAVVSPYNTYKNKGLPPGPICTPQQSTVDSVLNAPKTDYIYFVASSNFDGSHIFTSNYQEHTKYAKLYQQALDAQIRKRDSIRAAQ